MFIEVTDADSGEKMLLNLTVVESFYDANGTTHVMSQREVMVRLVESYEEIRKIIGMPARVLTNGDEL